MKSNNLSLKTIINDLNILNNFSYNSVKRLNKKDLLLLANNLIKNIPDPRNAIEHCQSFLIKRTENQ